MNISFVHLQNFRKLKDCRIEFSMKETIFVGPNNSGKTTAMDALILFLKARHKFTTRDFTISNWRSINHIGFVWANEPDFAKLDLQMDQWEQYLPTLDVWLNVSPKEVHYVSHLIPTLEWAGGVLGIRLRFEPDSPLDLYNEFIAQYNNSKKVSEARKNEGKINLWPKDLWDFLDRHLGKFFTVRTYLLNPELHESPQKLESTNVPLDIDAFSGLIKIDIINAQRGFSDPNSELADASTTNKTLSSQLRSYYDKHLNPAINPTEADLSALEMIYNAKESFDDNLKSSFAAPLKELEFLNYPGFGNPKIKLSTIINTVEGLSHESAVQYFLDESMSDLSLPEKYNGLGYQNLISIIFKLIRFRDEWMQVGKGNKTAPGESDLGFEPLHLVLIEEPEAHLHAQVQQVFIKEAFKTLRRHENLTDNNFTTQLVISTHSNHIAHEVDFNCLRYFKRQVEAGKNLHTSKVVNLSKTFGDETETTKFAIRYLKTTHSDLFFADAVIMVEGPAERMLIPYFIKHHTKMSNCYISILEIGGSHAHTLKPLIESLGIIALIITDIDSVDPVTNSSKVRPELLKGFKSGNDTLANWLPGTSDLDELLNFAENAKIDTIYPVRIAYQFKVSHTDSEEEAIAYPYTFEDSLVLENRSIFQGLVKATGLLNKMSSAAKEPDFEKSAQLMYDEITKKSAKKAEFALELFYFQDPNILKTPSYIEEGLKWLEARLVSGKSI